jgi:flavin reductase (DIM6/NTAB) family NADH-FMN oxidoreductase RutF
MKITSGEDFDAKDYRRALGQFATGVAIITTRSKEGRSIGLTVNSFTSVSLDPPLVLWCLVRHSPNLTAFQEASHFAVNILAAVQHGLSQKFASPVPDKFEGVPMEEGKAKVPLLTGVAAQLVCRNAGQFDGGDHVIFLGHVEEYHRAEEKPLVFHSGRYRSVAPHPDFPE